MCCEEDFATLLEDFNPAVKPQKHVKIFVKHCPARVSMTNEESDEGEFVVLTQDTQDSEDDKSEEVRAKF